MDELKGDHDKGREDIFHCSTWLSYPLSRGRIRTGDLWLHVVFPAFVKEAADKYL